MKMEEGDVAKPKFRDLTKKLCGKELNFAKRLNRVLNG